MRIQLIAVGNRMPEWVETGFQTYAKRMPPQCRMQLIEVAAGKRTKGADITRILADEGERCLSAVPARARVVALERTGARKTTAQLAQTLGDWLGRESDVALLIGGPEGLSAACLARADEQWSLSELTLPHPLVRVIVAEQFYRAWSILNNLPYHRGE